MSFFISQRVLCLTGSLLLVAMPGGFALSKETPRFVEESVYSPNAAKVARIISSSDADIVVLDGGLKQGLRAGMVCVVRRGLRNIAELLVVESRSDRSAALILELTEDAIIEAGDLARVKATRTR